MDCAHARVALSARLDGEDVGVEPTELDAHLHRCTECAAFELEAGRLHRAMRITPAEVVPDLTAEILTLIGRDPPGLAQWRALRWVLLVIGVMQLVAAIPALLGNDAGLPVHVAHHVGSFDIAVGVGFVFAAWRPTRVAGLLPVVAALVALLFGTSVIDVIAGRAGALNETQHLPEIVGLVALWLITRPDTGTRARAIVA